jgi:hypothetical protein
VPRLADVGEYVRLLRSVLRFDRVRNA